MKLFSADCTARVALVPVLASIVLWVAACAEINHLRDAQEAFNAAAMADNRARMMVPDSDQEQMPDQISTARAGYSSVILSLERLEASDAKAKLEADGLMGNVYALKAMAYWRLHDYDRALGAVAEAQRGAGTLGPRDAAMMAAMPGLIRNDQAYQKITAADGSQQDFDDVERLLNAAQPYFADARRRLSEGHPMQLYIAQSELALVRNFFAACSAYFQSGSPYDQCVAARNLECRAQTSLDNLEQVLDQSSTELEVKQKSALVLTWQNTLGVESSSNRDSCVADPCSPAAALPNDCGQSSPGGLD